MKTTMRRREIDSPYAWFRLAVSVLLSAIGGVGMWSVVVALPAVQAEFHAERGAASLPFTLTMIGFGVGGVIMGKLADRKGIVLPVMIGAGSLGAGFVAGLAVRRPGDVFGRLPVDRHVRHRRDLCPADGGYLVLVREASWHRRRLVRLRQLCVRRDLADVDRSGDPSPWLAHRASGGRHVLPRYDAAAGAAAAQPPAGPGGRSPAPTASLRRINLPPRVLQTLLAVAGLACCVAMSMPQVHIVAYCGDLGYGSARGAQMLSLMLGFGIVSRVGSGFLADRLGGLATLLIGSFAQMVALTLYLMMDGLTSLYVISALFGLFQGGLVPSYAIIVRESFPAREAGGRVGVILMMTLLGMALGGWMSGVIFDLTGSYRAAFANGVAWNGLNLLIAVFLLFRSPSEHARYGPKKDMVAAHDVYQLRQSPIHSPGDIADTAAKSA